MVIGNDKKGERSTRSPFSGAHSLRLDCELNGTVVVTVIFMWMMQMPINHIINVIAMWNRFVSAILAMLVLGAM